jgi:multiple sugar transport system substrate-binding protein
MKFKKIGIIFIIILLLMLTANKIQNNKSTQKVLQFSSWGSKSELDILKPVLNEFEKQNPDIKIEFIHIPQNYFQKLHLLFASNLAPDVIFINNLYLPIYANAGLLEEIQDDNSLINLSEFYEKSLKALSYKNKLYAIPRDISILIVYYNKNLFDKYNVEYPQKAWTFKDFLTTAQNLTKDINNDGQTDIWGISFEESLLFYMPYLMSEGGGVLSDNLKTLIINTPESQKGLNFYADLRNKYNVAPKKSESASATMAQMFLQEKLAMHFSGRWLVPKYRTDAKFNWDIINFPSGDKGSIVPLDASGWAVAKHSKYKKDALRLIQYLSSKESIEKFTQSGLIVPARIDVAEGNFLQDKKLPRNNQSFIDIIKTAKNTPVSVNYNEIQDDIKEKNDYLFNPVQK